MDGDSGGEKHGSDVETNGSSDGTDVTVEYHEKHNTYCATSLLCSSKI